MVAARGNGAEPWATSVAEEVHRRLQSRAAEVRRRGGDPLAELGDPRAVAAQMLAAVPQRSAWNALGPFFSTRGIAAVLGGVSRQAVEDRRRRHRLIALRTADGTWLYPAFQLDADRRLLGDVVAAHRRLVAAGVEAWTAASVLLGPQPELGGRSVRGHLAEGGRLLDVDHVLDAAVDAVA